MATAFTFSNTSGTLNFTLRPGQTNSKYDVSVFGQGTQLWGEDADRNFIRLMENFSAPQKVGGDYNPVSSSFDYDPNTQGILPKDSNDLGANLGINNPITGQMWFNSDAGSMFVFDEDIDTTFGWNRVGSVVTGSSSPSSPQQGDMWYDTNVPQLKIYNGTSWVSVADRYLLLDGTSSMSGNLDLGTNNIVNVVDPNDPQDGATKSYVDALRTDLTSNGLLDSQYVERDGDTMTGILSLDQTQGGYISILHSSSVLTLGQHGGVTAGSDIRKDSNMLVSADGNLYMHFSTGNSFRVARGGDNRNSGYTNLLTVNSDGLVNVIASYESLSLTNNSLVNKAYVDNNNTSLLNELNDVNTSPSDGDVLTYNNGSGDWEAGDVNNYAMPTGSIITFSTTTPPNGWLYCNGQAVSRTTYSNLFGVIGVSYGAGDGSTTFNLPDMRGEFVRGWDDGRGVDDDGGRSFGSVQGDRIRRHKHRGSWGERYTYDYFGRTNSRGYQGSASSDWDNFIYNTNDGTNYDGSVNPSGVIGNETRPRNIALIYIIKA